MLKLTKINSTQKEIMGDFMANHTDLAKSILPNTAQGKARANQLWEQLTSKLNASGPPIKDAKMWRKVYADQKQLIKRKFTFNKSSKKRTGGGPYEEKVLSQVDEQILAAAGIEVAVEGLKNIKTFGTTMQKKGEDLLKARDCSDNIFATTSQNNTSCNDSFTSACIIFDNEEVYTENISSCTEIEDNDEENEKAVLIKKVKPKIMAKINRRETKTTLLKKNMTATDLYHNEVLKRLDNIIEINNKKLELKKNEIELTGQLVSIKQKTLQIKERAENINIQIKQTELQIRKRELENLNMNYQMQ